MTKMKMAELISHIYQDNVGRWIIQSNEEHSVGVTRLASRFAGEFGMSEWGKVLGQLHDKKQKSKCQNVPQFHRPRIPKNAERPLP